MRAFIRSRFYSLPSAFISLAGFRSYLTLMRIKQFRHREEREKGDGIQLSFFSSLFSVQKIPFRLFRFTLHIGPSEKSRLCMRTCSMFGLPDQYKKGRFVLMEWPMDASADMCACISFPLSIVVLKPVSIRKKKKEMAPWGSTANTQSAVD